MRPRKRILHFEVLTEAQAAELDAAWQEVLSGKRTRLTTAAEELNEIMEKGVFEAFATQSSQDAGVRTGPLRRVRSRPPGYLTDMESSPHTKGFYTNDAIEEFQQQLDENDAGNYPRLLKLKNRHDPTNLFRLNANVRPSV